MKTSPRLQLQMLAQNSIFAVLLVAAAFMAVYLLKDSKLQWDITRNQRNQLSQASRDVLAKMPGPIVITAYSTTQDPNLGDIRKLIHEFVVPYQQIKSDITLKFVDPREQPKQTTAANIRANGELVIEWGKRSEHLTALNEQNMTNLLMRLSRSQERLIMYVDGHGERKMNGPANFDLGIFGGELGNKGFRTNSINLAIVQEVPSNVSVLVITQPRVDLLKGEVEKIKQYLERGGNLLWLVDPEPLHGLEPIAEYLDLRFTPGVVVDPRGQGPGGSATFAVGVPALANPISPDASLLTVFPFARQVGFDPESKTWHWSPLVEAAQRGWVETGKLDGDIQFDKNKDIPGPIVVAASAERDISGKKQRVVVTGSGNFLANTYIGNGGNLDLGVNMLNWLSEDENLITIQPRARVDSELNLGRAGLTSIVVGFLLLLPAAFLVAGGTIWWRRRKA